MDDRYDFSSLSFDILSVQGSLRNFKPGVFGFCNGDEIYRLMPEDGSRYATESLIVNFKSTREIDRLLDILLYLKSKFD